VEKFSLENVGKSAGIFNAEKLLDLNAWYIRECSVTQLTPYLLPFLEKENFRNPDEKLVAGAVETLKARSKTLADMAKASRFYFEEELSYDQKAAERFLKPGSLALMMEIKARLEEAKTFAKQDLESIFALFLTDKNIKLGDIAQPLRVALTGSSVSPGLFEVMEVLGKDRVLARIERAVTSMSLKDAASSKRTLETSPV
jgi:glutamyl-tRNA synthetase